ncbi:MAG TPA: hypothetical protein VIT64_13145 [Ilumatobacteraceae bacterium]
MDTDTDAELAAAVEPAPDSTASPVLVVHGAAVRNRQGFEAEVDRLARAVGGQRRFVPVFWGDLARPAESIESVLPYLEWLNRSRDGTVPVDDPAGAPATDDEPPLEEEEPLPEGEDDPPIRRWRRLIAQRELERMMDRVGANWRRQSAAARRRVIASIYRVVRAQYLAASAHFAGDIILYQRHHREIQSRVWETIMREAPGCGLPERPITVVAHSLGSSVAFDAAVAGSPRIHIDHLITCASTVPYFHVIGCSPDTITPHQPGMTTSLPPTIGRWTNFWIPLDPWGYLAAPAFRLADGSAPTDIEVHSGEREDKILRHAASNYWRHPTVINAIRAGTASPDH